MMMKRFAWITALFLLSPNFMAAAAANAALNSAQSDSVLFSCSAVSRGLKATFDIQQSGNSQLKLEEPDGTIHVCALELIQIGDRRKGLSPEIAILTERIKSCAPELPKKLTDELAVQHRVRIILRTPKEALISLHRADNDVVCHYRKLKQERFSALYKKWRLKPRRIPDLPPGAGKS